MKNLSLLFFSCLFLKVFNLHGQSSGEGVLNIKVEGHVDAIRVIEIVEGRSILINGGKPEELGMKASISWETLTDDNKITMVQTSRFDEPGYSGMILEQKNEEVIIRRIQSGTQAKASGLDPRDRIFQINNKKITSIQDLEGEISKMKKGDRVAIAYTRRGKDYLVSFDLDGSNSLIGSQANRPSRITRYDGNPIQTYTYKPIEKPVVREGLGIKIKDAGNQIITVTTVNINSRAEMGGIKVGDIIISINNLAVSTIEEVTSVIQSLPNDLPIRIAVKRDNKVFDLIIE